MPYTRKQVRYLLSDMSPLTPDQKTSMEQELHADPELGHKPAVKPAAKPKAAAPKEKLDSVGFSYNWKQHQGRPRP